MSYILDALNKSENERRAAVAPGLMPGTSFVVAPRKNSRRGSAAIVIGLGMLVTGLALGSWRPWPSVSGELEPRVVLLPTAVVPVVSRAAPSAAVVPPAPTLPTKPAPEPAPLVKAAQPVPIVAAVSSAAEKSPPKVSVRTPPPAKAAGAVAVPVASVSVTAPAARGKSVVSYGELPANIRQSLPEITFGGFAGTDDDAVNIAFINNRLVKAGEEVSPGLKLESVAQDGVVMAYQGYRFKP